MKPRLKYIIHPTCGVPMGEKPEWMSEGQWLVDQCRCLLLKGHEPPCKCHHMLREE